MTRWFVLGMLLAFLGGDVPAAEAPIPAAATTPAPAAPTAEDPLLTQVDQAILLNGHRYLVPVNTPSPHSPWQIFHGILAYRKDFLLKVGDQKVSAIEWIATSEPTFDRLPLLLITQHGAKFHPFTREYAFEGHPGQSLALLSETHLPTDFEFKIGNKQVKLSDFLNNTMMEVNNREEITWVLWGLNNYLKSDARWVNQWGEPWSIEKLVQLQVAARVVGGPCGGNHGLFALVRARDKYREAGNPMRGVWMQADQKINQYIEYARLLQNPDGSFSSNFYAGAGFSNDMNTRFNTTGHTLEFLSAGLPESRLNEPWVRKAVNVLSKELVDNRRAAASPGPLYHSINALRNYRDRVRKTPLTKPEEVAVAPTDRPTLTIPEAAPETFQPAIVPQTAPGIARTKPRVPTPPSTSATPKVAALTPRQASENPPAPLIIAPHEAIPAPLPNANLHPLIQPGRIQPGLLAADAPVSALAPANR